MQKIKIITILVFLIATTGCEKDLNTEVYNLKTEKTIVKEVSINDILLKSNNRLLKKIDEISTLKPNQTSKLIYSQEYNFYIDTEDGKYLQKGNYESYTFPIYRDNPNKNIENIIFSLNTNGEYDAYLANYDITAEELDSLTKEELSSRKVSFTKIKYSLTARIAPVCVYIWQLLDTGDLVGADSPKHEVWVLQAQYCTTGNSAEENGAPAPNPINQYDPANGGGGGSPNNGDPGVITSPVKGHGIYSDEDLAQHQNNCDMLKSLLTLTTTQYNWIKKTSNISVVSEFDLLLSNSNYTSESKNFIKDIITQMIANPSLKFDIYASFKSPMNIDRSAIDNNTTYGAKFNQIYDQLTLTPEFQNLFVKLFENNTRFNVKFEIVDNLPRPKKPNEQDNGQTVLALNSTNITIKINKQILISMSGGLNNLSKMAIAKVILHECIHAYLHIKGMYSNAGASIPGIEEMDLQKVINAIYGNNSDQHAFMYDHMVKTMQTILSQLKDKLTTLPRRNELLDLKIYTKIDKSDFEIWNWDNYFKYLSLSGLSEAKSFQTDFPVNSDAVFLFNNYTGFGEIYLDKN